MDVPLLLMAAHKYSPSPLPLSCTQGEQVGGLDPSAGDFNPELAADYADYRALESSPVDNTFIGFEPPTISVSAMDKQQVSE
jgi:hypothetical protein